MLMLNDNTWIGHYRLYKDEEAVKPLSRGGVTVFARQLGHTAAFKVGIAVCSLQDQYCRYKGRAIAGGRSLALGEAMTYFTITIPTNLFDKTDVEQFDWFRACMKSKADQALYRVLTNLYTKHVAQITKPFEASGVSVVSPNMLIMYNLRRFHRSARARTSS